MIEFVTVDGDHVWVAREKIIMVTGAKTQQGGGPPVPVVGVAMIAVAGVPPLVVKGSPDEIAIKVEIGDGGRSPLFSA